eukprot:1186384-Prorocentrum_minimum.AAC.1
MKNAFFHTDPHRPLTLTTPSPANPPPSPSSRGHATPEGGNDYYTLGVSQRGTTYHLSIGIRRRSRFVTLPVVNSSRGGMDAGPVGEVAVLLTAPLKMLLVVFTFSRVLRLMGVYT